MNQKTVLITGASRGIGKAIAECFAKNGYFVYLNARKSQKELELLAQDLTVQFSDCCKIVMGDVGNPLEVEQLFEVIKTSGGGPDVLINNAGIAHIGLMTDMTYNEWNRIISTNLSSVFYCSKCAVPYMLQRKHGHIINISSMWGTAGASCEAAYSASKAGVHGFTKALAKELAPSSIAVNAIACGVIDTKMNHCLSEEERELLCEEIPAGRFGSPLEVASLALSIAESSTYLTGQIIGMDGGFI